MAQVPPGREPLTATERAIELAWIVPTLQRDGIAITVRTCEGLLRETFPHGPKPRDLAGALELAAIWLRALEPNH